MKNIKPILISLVMIIAGIRTVKAQKTEGEIRKMIESKSFVFTAQTAKPLRGGIQQLSSGYYELTVNPGTVMAYLPFYGRAQTVPIGASEGGIKFSSSNFQYEVLQKNKSWRITIKTNDVSHVRQLYLTIYENGNATLDVMNINRDDISFSGYIK